MLLYTKIMKHLIFFGVALYLFVSLLLVAASQINTPHSTVTEAAVNNTVRFNTAAVGRVSALPNPESFTWVAVDSSNVSHIVYLYRITPEGNTYQLMYTRSSGAAFTSPVVLDSLGTVGDDSRPIIVFANGSLHLTYTINEKQVIYRQGNISGAWGPPVVVHTTATTTYGGGLAVEPGGAVHFVYLDKGCGTYEVFHKRYAGGVLSAASIPVNDCVYKNRPRAVYAGNALHVIFRRDQEIYYTRLQGGGWTPGTNISNSPATTSHNPAIGANGTSVFVAWGEGVNGHDVQFRYSPNNGQTWSGQILPVSTTSPVFAQHPNIVWVPSVNRGYIVWADATTGIGGTPDIIMHEFEAAPVNFNNPVQLTCLAGDSTWPVIAAGPSRAEIVWQDKSIGNQLKIFHVSGQIGAGQITTGCGVAASPAATIPVPTATPTTPPPPPTAIPTTVPANSPTPTVTPFPPPLITYYPPTLTPLPTDIPVRNTVYNVNQSWILLALVGMLVFIIGRTLF